MENGFLVGRPVVRWTGSLPSAVGPTGGFNRRHDSWVGGCQARAIVTGQHPPTADPRGIEMVSGQSGHRKHPVPGQRSLLETRTAASITAAAIPSGSASPGKRYEGP